jgi:hypothetical protein
VRIMASSGNCLAKRISTEASRLRTREYMLMIWLFVAETSRISFVVPEHGFAYTGPSHWRPLT